MNFDDHIPLARHDEPQLSKHGRTAWALVKPGPTHWYHVARVVFVDGAWWEVYWHESHATRGKSKATVREYAKNACALVLLPDVYTKDGAQMNRLKVMS